MAGSEVLQERTNRLLTESLTRPVRMVIVLFLAAVLIKIVDTFVFRLDELLGEAILTKSMGFVLVAAYVWACGRSLGDIGFRREGAGYSLLIGGVCTLGLFVLSYGIQLIILGASGDKPSIVITAVDPKSGMSGGLLFGLWLVLTNLVNSAMEEGLFRGVMLRHLLIKYTFWGALLFQAFLFAIWHLSWPVKNWLWQGSTAGEASFEALFLFAGTFVSGLFHGYLYLKTNNLWGSFLAHTINNTLMNVLFIRVAVEAQPVTQYMPFIMIYTCGLLLLMPLINWWSKRLRIPEVEAWA